MHGYDGFPLVILISFYVQSCLTTCIFLHPYCWQKELCALQFSLVEIVNKMISFTLIYYVYAHRQILAQVLYRQVKTESCGFSNRLRERLGAGQYR